MPQKAGGGMKARKNPKASDSSQMNGNGAITFINYTFMVDMQGSWNYILLGVVKMRLLQTILTHPSIVQNTAEQKQTHKQKQAPKKAVSRMAVTAPRFRLLFPNPFIN